MKPYTQVCEYLAANPLEVGGGIGLKALSKATGCSTSLLIEGLKLNLANTWALEDHLAEVGLVDHRYVLEHQRKGRYSRYRLVRTD